jgi:hypothetical protein
VAPVIELVVFKAKEGISKEQMQAAAESITPILAEMDGYASREIAVTIDGQWTDIVHWIDLESAQKAAKSVMEIPVCLEFFKLIDEKQMTMFHLNLVASHS